MVPLNSIDDKDISIENNDINFHTFYTPYRNEYDNIKDRTSNFKNNNSNSIGKSSSDYKKYRTLNNLSSLYPLPYASPLLFKSKTNIGSNNKSNSSTNTIKIPLSSEYWRNRLKKRELLSTIQPLLLD